MKNKYGSIYPYNFDVCDEEGNVIAKLDTLQETEIIFSKTKIYLKIIDALMDMDFISHVKNNRDYIYTLKGQNIYTNAESGCNITTRLYISQAKVIRTSIPQKNDHCLPVVIIFEIINDSTFDLYL